MHKRSSAFTIVELLVVIVVIGVLASIALVSYTGISKKATEASVISDLDNSTKQFKLFQIENSNYPTDIELNCTTPAISTNKCIKLSGSNTPGKYTVDNTPGSQTFCLTIKNGTNIIKHIDQDGIIADNACTYAFPGNPLLASGVPTINSIPLSWSPITGTIDGYTLERATNIGFTANLTTVTPAPATNVTSYTSTGLTSGTTYFYRLKVTMSGDISIWSTIATNSTKATLTITAGANGSVNTGVNGDYVLNATPTITATPAGGYAFSSWTGDTGCAGTASHAITMDSNKTCTANFVFLPNYLLTLIAGAGGTVAGGGSYVSGSSRTIMATANFPYLFNSWTGTGCSTGTVLMDSNKTCTANFTLDPNWYAGVGGLAGKFVYKTDAGAYKMNTSSPDFTAGCVAGGRWPNLAELQAMSTDRASYGGFVVGNYWSSTALGSWYAYYVDILSNWTSSSYSDYWWLVRCVAG